MIYLDAHCDTITRIVEEDGSLYENLFHVDIKRLKIRDKNIQFFASFIEPTYCPSHALERALVKIHRLKSEIQKYRDDIMLCCNFNEIEKALKEDKVAAILSVESGDALQGDLAVLAELYRLGVRSMCLTWNYRNQLADGAMEKDAKEGLTEFGRAVVREMNKLRMLVDVSHLSEPGFWDVIETATMPFIASHSNARARCDHPRNLTDPQIMAICHNGGVIGINLYPAFLDESGKATLEDAVKHIEHVCSLSGTDHVGMGCDLDGIDHVPAGLKGVESVGWIFNRLLQLNYPEEAVGKIAGTNFLRVIRQVMK